MFCENLPIEMSEKLFQGFITLCLVPCGKLQVACLSQPLWTKPFMCVTARGEQERFGAGFVRSVPKAAPPAAILPVREEGSVGSLVHGQGLTSGIPCAHPAWDPALLVPL